MMGKKSIQSGKRRSRKETLEVPRTSQQLENALPGVFMTDFPQMCVEFGATIIPEVMIREHSGKIVPVRPSSKEMARGRESEERRPRKSRILSLSPGRMSVAQLVQPEQPAASASTDAHAPRPSTAGVTEVSEDTETIAPSTNFVIISFEDEKKRENVKSITFKGFQIEEAHVRALHKGLLLCPGLSSITFKQSQLRDMQIPLLAEILNERGTNLVEICVEDNPSQEQNYYILLRECKKLQVLFLRGCKIDNEGTKLIADQLIYTEENAQKCLLYLNLSKNMIEDEGAAALAKALRTNRDLVGLTLCGNVIGDDGAIYLADALVKFQLADDEIKQRRIVIKQRIQGFQKLKEESTSKAPESVSAKPSPAVIERTARSARSSMKNEDQKRSGSKVLFPGTREMWKQVDEETGIIKNPLVQEVWPDGGNLWCAGNLHLQHLNLSFNRINILGAQRFLQALYYQIALKSSLTQNAPSGLINLVLHGNPIPATWSEWGQMYEMLSQLSGKQIAQKHSEASVESQERRGSKTNKTSVEQ